MEYVDGPSLQYLIEKNRRLSIDDAISYSIQMCNALDYLRQKNTVHHDIKPSNIVISMDKQVKLTDFGIAYSEGFEGEIWASLVAVGGTPAYLAPEKIKNHSVNDFRSDIYSLGVLMYNMFTGKLPFNGSLDEIIGAQITQNFISPSVLNPQISPAIERIILKAMAPSPNERYQDATSLKYDLEKAMTMAQNKPPKFSLKAEFGIPLWILYLILGIVIAVTLTVTIYVQMSMVK
jgi:serine/threonine-protein kinase